MLNPSAPYPSLFNVEVGGSVFLWNVGIQPQYLCCYTAHLPGRPQSERTNSGSALWSNSFVCLSVLLRRP